MTEGYPKQTCLNALKNQIEKYAYNFAVSTFLGGINCLFLFFMHFCLYSRKD